MSRYSFLTGNFCTAAIFCCIIAALAGCGGDDLSPRFTGAQAAKADLYAKVMEGTVGSLAALEGGGDQIVRGHGLVVGLAGNGSSEVPATVRKRLSQQMGRMGLGDKATGTQLLSPDKLIDDPDTAVVEVSAAIAPGTPAGIPFDIQVAAISGSETVSLDGGTLFRTDLHSFIVSGGDLKESLPVASGRGDVFVNPFVDINNPTESVKLTRGVIPGGGMLKESRKLALVLSRPDYGLANMLQKEINSRFPSFPKTAVAKNQSLIEINIPAKWQKDHGHFLELMTHLYVRRGGAFVDMKIRNLAEQITKPDAPYEDIAFIWEAMGRQVLPVISKLYLHENPYVRFFAAKAGARMEDVPAISVLIEFAKNESDLQLSAIAELGRCGTLAAIDTLKTCFDSDNDLVRIAAFHAMDSIGPIGGVKYKFVGKSFDVYQVPSKARPIVYATRTEKETIVIFGENLLIRRPVFFTTPDEMVTINSDSTGNKVQMYRKVGAKRRLSDVLESTADLWSVISTLGGEPAPDEKGDIQGLGLTYSQVVSVLYRLCEGDLANRRVPAEFVLQKPSIRATISKTRPMEGRSN